MRQPLLNLSVKALFCLHGIGGLLFSAGASLAAEIELNAGSIYVGDFAGAVPHTEFRVRATPFTPKNIDLIVKHSGLVRYCAVSHTDYYYGGYGYGYGGYGYGYGGYGGMYPLASYGTYAAVPYSYEVCERQEEVIGPVQSVIHLELENTGGEPFDLTLVMGQDSAERPLQFDVLADHVVKKKLYPAGTLQREANKWKVAWRGIKRPGVALDFGLKTPKLKRKDYRNSPYLERVELAADGIGSVLVPKQTPADLQTKVVFHRSHATPPVVTLEVETLEPAKTCLLSAPVIHDSLQADRCVSWGSELVKKSFQHSLRFKKACPLAPGDDEVFELTLLRGKHPLVAAPANYKVKEPNVFSMNVNKTSFSCRQAKDD